MWDFVHKYSIEAQVYADRLKGVLKDFASLENEKKTLEKRVEEQQKKLKQLRRVLRQHDIGHLYPGVDPQYEESQRTMREQGLAAAEDMVPYLQDGLSAKEEYLRKLEALLLANDIELPEKETVVNKAIAHEKK